MVARSRFGARGVYMRRKEDGAALQRARKASGLTQGELAFLVDRSHTTIYLLEKPGPRGMQTCSAELGARIAKRLHRPVEDLFEVRDQIPAARVTTGQAVAGEAIPA